MKYDHAFAAGQRYRINSDAIVHRSYWGDEVEFVRERGYNFSPSCFVRVVRDGRELCVSPAHLEVCDGEAYS